MPKVSFVIPCYKLGHLLKECVDSILMQTFADFEILIMDDCSPDNTPEVAESFQDIRVRHIRNELNLGHLKNYNKGIGLSCGDYIWLISADDRLLAPYVLERYVRLLDANKNIGFAFCASVELLNGKEGGLVKWAYQSEQNRIFAGHDFLKELIRNNKVVASSGMARKECYEKVSYFPLDMPYAGDWYLWSAFALFYDVAYFAEPMVAYRLHESSMTTQFGESNPCIFSEDNQRVLWGIMKLAAGAGDEVVEQVCKNAICERFRDDVRPMLMKRSPDGWEWSFEQLLRGLASHDSTANKICHLAYVKLGDEFYWDREEWKALELYERALRLYPWSPKDWSKYLLAHMGGIGQYVRNGLQSLKREKAADLSRK